MTTAYSYIRFSTSSQKQGRSYARQMEACVAWCAKHDGMHLSDESFFDEGVSGYSGEHVGSKGQLKRFLDLVEKGKIAKGSYLVIESLDRLSRQSVNEALPMFIGLLNADINIVTLMDNERVYSKDFTASDLIISILVMTRANEESATKSKRGLDDWQSKFRKAREEKTPVGKRVVQWVELVEEDHKKFYRLKGEHVEVIKRVFRDCIAGRGFVAVAKSLNQDGVKAFKGGNWCSSSVDDLLKNRCVLGEWEPKDGKGVIEDYFPRVIDNATWDLAQLAMADRRGGLVTKQASNFQVWQRVGYCAVCLASLVSIGKGTGYTYMACSNKRKGLCKAINVPIGKSERVFKEILIKVGALGLIQTDAAALMDEMTGLDASIHRQQQLLDKHMAAAEEVGASSAIYRLITKAEQAIVKLTEEKHALEVRQATQTLAQGDKAWLLANIPLVERDDRQKANALLRRLGVTVRQTGGETAVYICTQRGKDFLQLMLTGDDVVVIPLNQEQRDRFKEQDADGKDLEAVDEWLAKTMGIPKPSRHKAA